MLSKIEMTEAILLAKSKKNVKWEYLSKELGLSEVFTTSVCLGQNTFSKTEAEKLGTLLNLPAEVVNALQVFPTKGQGQVVPTDPLIYRFFEICYVYGPTIKEVIHEKLGDGIM